MFKNDLCWGNIRNKIFSQPRNFSIMVVDRESSFTEKPLSQNVTRITGNPLSYGKDRRKSYPFI